MEYELTIKTRPAEQAVTLRLRDEHGQQHGFHELTLSDHRPALWEGVFDTRRHVSRYKGSQQWESAAAPETEEQILTRWASSWAPRFLGRRLCRRLRPPINAAACW